MPPDRSQAEMDQDAEEQPAEFRKKDGSISKMRSHRGNVPVLPQTKLCPHCPAKFTRTTHLNRHLRTHTGERLHCCDTCSSQFTRSDLLARHKKRCSSESKIKCDRQLPCSKCRARNKECVFTPADRPTQKSSTTGSASETTSNCNSSPSTLDADGFTSTDGHMSNIPGSSSGTTHSDVLVHDFAPTPFLNGYNAFPNLMMAPQPDEVAQNSFASAYNSDLFQPFLDGIFSSHSPSNSNSSDSNSPEQSMFADFSGVQSFFSSFGFIPDASQHFSTDASGVQPALSDIRSSNSTPDVPNSGSTEPLSAECQHYLYFFFSAFLPQMPIVHAPTFNVEGKPPLLLSAMQACGALYVKTRKATLFIEQTLTNTRETLVQEFPRDSTEQLHLIMAVILLQTIGLFHQKAEQRATSTIFHGMLVQMIRRSGLIPGNASWHPATIDPSRLDETWRSWARFEMTKRLLSQSFLQDCCHAEWYMLLQNPNSPYGSMEARLVGPNMRRCLDSMSDPQLLTQPTPVSPFGHFVLAHALLRILFDVCVESRLPTSGNTSEQTSVDKEIYKIQFGLHNWLQSWLASPDLPKTGDPNNEPPFVDNALPFYWFGQVALLAYQEGLAPFEPGSPNNEAESRYKLAKQWFRHIRSFLTSSDQGATMFWDELIKIRLQSWQVDRENNLDDSEGVLSFFES
ncbi:hypothetical protein BDZ89DRAFT_1072206 [Hymenopellis radicata]|nr:hypothetical protein BDZ89DRAFT_1072206 [Hymenopellis radicata]